MITVNARKFLQYSTEELFDKLEGDFNIRFDDGNIIQTNEKEVVYSSFFWDFHRNYPNTLLLSTHHVQHVLKGKRLGSNTHFKMFEKILWSTYDSYMQGHIDKVELIDCLNKLAYEVTNNIYNVLTYRLEEYVSSVDVTDFMEIINHPEIKLANDTVVASEKSIEETYEVIRRITMDNNQFIGNPLANSVKAGSVDFGQFVQCVGPRGYIKDVDSFRFDKPILRGYVHGIRSLEDSMMESRVAAMSLMYSTDQLSQSEYWSRRLQFVCQSVQNLHRYDCGSTHYLMWRVRGESKDENGRTISGDLETIQGKYYLNEVTNKLDTVKVTDTHLIGKQIKMRSPVSGCLSRDPYGICEVCFGENSLAIPENTNLGQACSTAMTDKVSSNILKTKHLVGSANIEGIIIPPCDKPYLASTVNGNLYFLNEALASKEVKLILHSSQTPGFADLMDSKDIYLLNASRVSSFDQIKIVVSDKKGTDIVPLTVCIKKRKSSATHAFLKFIKERGWDITEKEEYVVNMSGWNYKEPILSLPMVEVNMSDHQADIADILEATVKDLVYRDSIVSPEAVLVQLHDTVNQQLDVNLALLEVVLYSSMIVSAANNDYSLPKPWTDRGLGVMRTIMFNRSAAPYMAYERHKDFLLSPMSYTFDNRPDHPMDAGLMPKEVLSNNYKQR